MENTGARMQVSLTELPRGGLSALTRLMSIASAAAAIVVVLYAIATIVLGTIAVVAGPGSWTIGEKPTGKTVVKAQMSVMQTTAPVAVQPDPACPELKAAGGDVTKCRWVTSGPEGAAAANPSRVGGFAAAIRPVLWSLPVFLLAAGLLEASRCLDGLTKGRYFTAGTVSHLRNFALAGLLYVLLTPCMPAIATAVCSGVSWIASLGAAHPAGAVSIPAQFQADAVVGGVSGFSGFLIALYAFTLAIIATAMARASAIIDDHAEII